MNRSNKNVRLRTNWLTIQKHEVRLLTKSTVLVRHTHRISSAATRSLQRLSLTEANNEDYFEGHRKRTLQNAQWK